MPIHKADRTSLISFIVSFLIVFGLTYVDYHCEKTAIIINREVTCSHYSQPITHLVMIENEKKIQMLAFIHPDLLKKVQNGHQVSLRYYPGVPYPTIQEIHQWMWWCTPVHKRWDGWVVWITYYLLLTTRYSLSNVPRGTLRDIRLEVYAMSDNQKAVYGLIMITIGLFLFSIIIPSC